MAGIQWGGGGGGGEVNIIGQQFYVIIYELL